MADKISVSVTYEAPDGKKSTKAITDISPYAPPVTTRQFCEQLFALTDNTVSSMEKVERTDITVDDVSGAFPLTVNPAVAVKDSFVNGKLEIDIVYTELNGGWDLPVVTGQKPKDSTIAVESHKITVTLADRDYDEGDQTAEMQISIASKLAPESYTYKFIVRIADFTAADIEAIS